MNRNIIETVMGGVVILVAIFFVVFAFSSTDVGTVSGYTVSATFQNADGLRPGTEVRISGVKVGTVVDQRLDPETYQAQVKINIVDSIKLPEDTSARVLADGLLGGNFIMLEPGGAEENLKDGDKIQYAASSMNVIDIVQRIIFSGIKAESEGKAEGGGESGVQ